MAKFVNKKTPKGGYIIGTRKRVAFFGVRSRKEGNQNWIGDKLHAASKDGHGYAPENQLELNL